MSFKWHQPETAHDAVTCLEYLSWLIAFLNDTFSQTERKEFQFSINGQAGLSMLLLFIEDVTARCMEILAKEARHAD